MISFEFGDYSASLDICHELHELYEFGLRSFVKFVSSVAWAEQLLNLAIRLTCLYD